MIIIKEFFRWLALVSGWPMQLLFFKRKIYYEDPAEKNRRLRGGALIISNHYSVWDYMLNMFLFYGRKLNVVMIDRPYKKFKYFKPCMDCFGGICSNRDDMGMKFIDESVETIENGGLVQIFPEAQITSDRKMLPFKHAYLMIALAADAPIIPVMLDGNYGVFKQAHVLIGKKIDLSDYSTELNPSREEISRLNAIVEGKCRGLKAELDKKNALEKRNKNRKEN
ncbi:MAG: 1-acyl-sn-glycerol-3-phosphate acyltransferase [Clostridia bacterium]|nr:1-acyl-sn-glycerol-3-phosphate acyltransferase [Clostridia bacterium]